MCEISSSVRQLTMSLENVHEEKVSLIDLWWCVICQHEIIYHVNLFIQQHLSVDLHEQIQLYELYSTISNKNWLSSLNSHSLYRSNGRNLVSLSKWFSATS